MNAVKLDAEAGEVDHSSLLTVVLHLSQLLESFILSSFPHFTTDTGTYIQYICTTDVLFSSPKYCAGGKKIVPQAEL